MKSSLLSLIPTRLALIVAILICRVPCLAAGSENWQRKDVDIRLGGQKKITRIHYRKGDEPRLRAEGKESRVRKTVRTVRTRRDTAKSMQQQTIAPPVMVNTIDSPPIDGFVPWIAVTVTNKHSTEEDTVAQPHMSIRGRPFNDDPNNFTIGLFDTGASATVMSNRAGIRFGIFNDDLLTPTIVEVVGATGSVFPWVSYPLGLFIDGLDAIEPNSPTEPHNLILDTSDMVGQSNVSILVGDTPPSDGNDLPNAIGAPMAVNFTTSIRNDQSVTVTHQGQTYTGPAIEFYDHFDPDIPQYDTEIPLNLIPRNSIQVSYIYDFEALMTELIFRPGTPSLIAGEGYQSLFFVGSVDLYDEGGFATEKDRFMLDTGAQITVVGKRVGSRLGFDPADPNFWVEIIDVTGQARMEPGFYIDKLDIPTLGQQWLTFTDVPVILLDIASPEGGTLDGIIGMNLFTQYNMVLKGDYSAPSLYVDLISQQISADIAPEQPDGVVDLKDFALFARSWMTTESPPSPAWNEKCDLAPDGKIDAADLAIFADQWLDGTNF